MSKDLMIRSSVQEFITFKVQEQDKGIQVRYENENLWMTQKSIAIWKKNEYNVPYVRIPIRNKI